MQPQKIVFPLHPPQFKGPLNAPLGSEAEQSSAAATESRKLRLVAKNISVQKGKLSLRSLWRFDVATPLLWTKNLDQNYGTGLVPKDCRSVASPVGYRSLSPSPPLPLPLPVAVAQHWHFQKKDQKFAKRLYKPVD